MGERTTISGHIQEPWYVRGDEAALRLFRAANSRVLRSLPIRDSWPSLHRGMFARSPQGKLGASSSFRGTVIHFGGSFSKLYTSMSDWREKFEGLLRRMYWEHAAVIVVTEWVGTRSYLWEVTPAARDAMTLPTLSPVNDWTLETSPNPL